MIKFHSTYKNTLQLVAMPYNIKQLGEKSVSIDFSLWTLAKGVKVAGFI